MEASANRVITTAALISVGVGTLNSFYKYKKPPSARFLIGSGAAYVILSAIGEGEPEVAKALALAVATTVIIGDGGGVLSYLNNGEIDTKKPNPLSAEDGTPLVSSADLYEGEEVETFTPDPTPLQERNWSFVWPSSTVAIHEQPFEQFPITPIPGIQ